MDGVLLLLFPLPCLLSAQLSTVSGPDVLSSLDPNPTPFPTAPNTSITSENSLYTSSPPSTQGPDPTIKVNVDENRSVAERYLYTGELSSLINSSCTQTFQLPIQQGSPPRDLFPFVHQAIASLTNAANFLNLIFQASELRETSVREDIEWYHALVRALLEGEKPGLVRRAFLTFDADPTIQQPQLVLRASKGSTQDILLQDLTSVWSSLLPPAPDQNWFHSFKSSSPPLHALPKRVLLNDLSTLDTPKWARGDSYVINSSGVQWGGSPFLECVDGRFLPGWLISLSMPFYGLKPDLSPEFRGVIRVDVNIQGFNVDQCASGDFWFANTHKCNRTSMECVPIPQQGFRMGQYCCRCKKGYYSLLPDVQNKKDSWVNASQVCYPEIPVCLPCWPGCAQCEDGAPCWVQEDWLLRAGVLVVQGIFMILVVVSMLVAYQCRKTKHIRSSGLLLLEMILCGSLLLYFPVFILYFKPSTFRCILLRWVRLLGFAIVYGTVMLKMYRVLKVFLSRTALRVPYITTTGVLRMLGVIVLTVSWFLCAWTVGVLQNRDRNVPLLIIYTTSEGQGFNVCDLDRWDYMMAVAELLFLCWGRSLCSAVKTVPSAFHEPRYMSIAIHNELLLSSLFHLLRFVRPSLHPDWMLLLFFTHTHVTITVTLGLLFIPKILLSRSGREEIAAEVYEDEVYLRRSCSYLNSSFTSNCCSDHSLDPDDIRDELKKLYTQLEVRKTKRMTNNNPHLPKKRSSRLSIGRSLIKRITEIPESLSRQCSREDKDVNSAIGTVSRAGSYYKSHQTTSINIVNELLMQPSPKLRKSHSAYDCARERHNSLVNSSIKSTADKRASQHSDAGSINTTLLVCKSASAHNLTADTNFLLPEPTRFQKSLSVIERNGHRSLKPSRSIENVSVGAKATHAEKHQQNVDGDIKKQTSSALLSESFDKAEVCPWEVPDEHLTNKNQKHVTYSLANQEEPKSPDGTSSPSLLYVCPWEYLPPPSPPATENGNGIQSDVDPTKHKPLVSCSAPGSPHTVFGMPKDFRAFSFRTATQSLLVAKGIGETGRSMSREKSQEFDVKEGILHKSLSTSMRLSPASATLNKRTPQTHRRAMTTIGTKPCLVKQTAIRQPSTESPERSPKHLAPVHICPWESEEIIMEVKKQNVKEDQAPSSTYGLQFKSLLTVPNTEVCPWDVPKPFHQTSISEVCPWEVEEEEEQLQIKSIHTDACPWDADSNPSQDTKDNTCDYSVQKQANAKPEVCRSYVLDTNDSQVGQENRKSPSDSIKPGERVIYVHAEKGPADQETEHSDACTFQANETKKQECDFPEPLSPITDASLWKSEAKAKATTRNPSQEIVTQNPTVFVWGVEDFDKSEEMASAKEKGLVKLDQESVHVNVCPWETEEAVKNLQKQESLHADVCPWETEEPVRNFQKQESVRSDICPWDSEEPMKTSQTHESVRPDVCPWESEEPSKTLQKQESVYSDICPWEAKPSIQPVTQSTSHDVTSKRQDSVQQNDMETPAEDSMNQNVIQPADEDTETTEEMRNNPPLARRDALCPWETERTRQESITAHDNLDVFTWEETIPEEDDGDAETAAEAFIFPPDL